MKLQKNTLLALYSVIEFAGDPTRHISAAEIADKHGVSAHHLAKVLAELARAGVVESIRGVGGGYRFAGNLRRLTLMDIIQLFEDFDPPEKARNRVHQRQFRGGGGLPVAGDTRPHSALAVDLALVAVLSEIDEITKATFRSITLATMLRLVERQQGERPVTIVQPGAKARLSRPAARQPRRNKAGGRPKVA